MICVQKLIMSLTFTRNKTQLCRRQRRLPKTIVYQPKTSDCLLACHRQQPVHLSSLIFSELFSYIYVVIRLFSSVVVFSILTVDVEWQNNLNNWFALQKRSLMFTNICVNILFGLVVKGTKQLSFKYSNGYNLPP